MDFKNVKKILVIKFRHIGDVLLTVPAIKALKGAFPDAEVSVLVNSGTEDVLSGNPLIDELIVFDRAILKLPSLGRFIREKDFLKKIRARNYDMTVDLTGGDRAAIVSFMSGARYRLAADPGKKGFAGKRFLYTHLTGIDKQKHMALQNLDVVRKFGITSDDTDVAFFVREEARLTVDKIFKEHNVSENDTVVHVHAASRWLFKCWKDEYMAGTIAWLIDKGIKVVVTSAPDEQEITKTRLILSLIPDPQSQIPNLLDLSGRTTIEHLAAISAASDLFIGVDSAPMHIAAAVKTPVIALFGPTGEDVWGPYGEGHVVLSKKLACKPCKKGRCEGIRLRECMEAIKPDDVKEAVLGKLKTVN